MKTLTGIRRLQENPGFSAQRERYLRHLDLRSIDGPISALISRFARLEYCFTLQSCWGHFLWGNQRDPYGVFKLPPRGSGDVEYRVAYLALCLDTGEEGRSLFQELEAVPAIDPETVQFGCALWYWERQVNSYVVQVAPHRHRNEDRFWIDYREALHIQDVRDRFFEHLEQIVERRV
jgi:hypothetical protein